MGRAEVRTVNWFFPDIDSPFYGGINTALRMADQLRREHGVEQRFVRHGEPQRGRSSARRCSPPSPTWPTRPLTFYDGAHRPGARHRALRRRLDRHAVGRRPTRWPAFQNTRRKFYLIQDFEPQFYPAGTNYALTEEGYRLGLYGLCNTQRLLDIYRARLRRRRRGASCPPSTRACSTPADRRPLRHDGPGDGLRVRPARPLAQLLGDGLAGPRPSSRSACGDDVRIVTAGSWARPDDLGGGIEHLGLLDYRDTGELYRTLRRRAWPSPCRPTRRTCRSS